MSIKRSSQAKIVFLKDLPNFPQVSWLHDGRKGGANAAYSLASCVEYLAASMWTRIYIGCI